MANVDGSWDCVVKSPLGDQKMTLTVNSADTSFSGAVSGAMGGMDVTGEVDGDTLSWKQAGRYPADLILHDTRAFSLQPGQLSTYPTWAALPAVRAGQVGSWSAETRLSAQGFAAAVEDLAATVAAARADVVS